MLDQHYAFLSGLVAADFPAGVAVLGDVAAETRAVLAASDDWKFVLTAGEIAELDDAVAGVEARGLQIKDITFTDFPRHVLDDPIARAAPRRFDIMWPVITVTFGEAINLHDTDAALFVMLPWTPGQVRQWEGRFCRLGQKRPVVIYYVISEDTVDEHVADKLIGKLPGAENLRPADHHD